MILWVLTPGLAQADVVKFAMPTDNAQAQAGGNCLLGSTARGSGTATFDTGTLLLTWNITFGNNSPLYDNGTLDQGAESAAHFHAAAPGVNGPVRVGVGTGNPKVGSATLSAAQAAELQQGLFYINIHSAGCGTGEIRGQLLKQNPVPAVGAAGLVMLTGVVAAGGALLLRWRRRSGATA
jgi:hypothetical protein